jgi:hypothetical protein
MARERKEAAKRLFQLSENQQGFFTTKEVSS